jgi:hypothetical protein
MVSFFLFSRQIPAYFDPDKVFQPEIFRDIYFKNTAFEKGEFF